MERLLCPCCGGDLQIKEDLFECVFCKSIYSSNTRREIEELKTNFNLLEEKLIEQKLELLAGARRTLFSETKEKYLDVTKLKASALHVKSIFEEDFLAEFYLNVCDGNINEYLNNFDTYESIDYLKIVLNFLLDRYPLKASNLIPMRNIVELGFDAEEKAFYNRKIEEKAKEIDSGIFDVDIPRDVFVAYSSKDYEKVYETVELLEENGLKCFVALRNLPTTIGSKENYQINLERAIRACKCFLFISSENSRDADCDAIKEEIPYLLAHENIKRVEYLIEKYGRNTSRVTNEKLRATFKNLQWVIDKEDLVNRIHSILSTKYKFCISCLKEIEFSINFCPNCSCSEFAETYEEAVKIKAKRDAEKELLEAKSTIESLKQKEEQRKLEEKLKEQEKLLADLKKQEEQRKLEEQLQARERELENLKKKEEQRLLEEKVKEQERALSDLKRKEFLGQVSNETVTVPSGNSTLGLVARMDSFLSQKDFKKVEEYTEKILDVDLNSGVAYAYKLLAEYKETGFENFINYQTNRYTQSKNYLKAVELGYTQLLEIEEKRKEHAYLKAQEALLKKDFNLAKTLLESIKDYKDASVWLKKTLELEKEQNEINKAKDLFEKKDYLKAKEIIDAIPVSQESIEVKEKIQNALDEETYKKAYEAYSNQEYGPAIELLKSIPNQSDAKTLLQKIQEKTKDIQDEIKEKETEILVYEKEQRRVIQQQKEIDELLLKQYSDENRQNELCIQLYPYEKAQEKLKNAKLQLEKEEKIPSKIQERIQDLKEKLASEQKELEALNPIYEIMKKYEDMLQSLLRFYRNAISDLEQSKEQFTSELGSLNLFQGKRKKELSEKITSISSQIDGMKKEKEDKERELIEKREQELSAYECIYRDEYENSIQVKNDLKFTIDEIPELEQELEREEIYYKGKLEDIDAITHEMKVLQEKIDLEFPSSNMKTLLKEKEQLTLQHEKDEEQINKLKERKDYGKHAYDDFLYLKNAPYTYFLSDALKGTLEKFSVLSEVSDFISKEEYDKALDLLLPISDYYASFETLEKIQEYSLDKAYEALNEDWKTINCSAMCDVNGIYDKIKAILEKVPLNAELSILLQKTEKVAKLLTHPCFGEINGEKLYWKVLDVSYGIVTLISEKIMDAEKFGDDSVNYMNSDVRETLYNLTMKMFTSSQLDAIIPTEEEGLNGDYFYLLSKSDCERFFPGDKERKAECSLNAKKSGLQTPIWWTRTQNSKEEYTTIREDGSFGLEKNPNKVLGIRPAFRIDIENISKILQ